MRGGARGGCQSSLGHNLTVDRVTWGLVSRGKGVEDGAQGVGVGAEFGRGSEGQEGGALASSGAQEERPGAGAGSAWRRQSALRGGRASLQE